VIGKRRPVDLGLLVGAERRATLDEAQVATRKVWFEEGWLETPIYRRDFLPEAAEFTGPAIVEQLDSTTVIEPGNRVRIDPLGNLVVAVEPAS
jgi:N-methylhydantoinase A